MSGFIINPYAFGVGGAVETMPLLEADPDGSTGSTNGQVGWGFSVSSQVVATGGRIRLAANGAETLKLWRVSDEALLASVEITSVNGEWVSGDFSSSVTLSTGETYLVATRRTNATSRDRRFNNVSGFTLASFVTYEGAVSTNTADYPGAGFSNNGLIQGWADILVEVP